MHGDEYRTFDLQTLVSEAQECRIYIGPIEALRPRTFSLAKACSLASADASASPRAPWTLRKSERRVKELTFAADEDAKNHERMQALVDQLQAKIKSYKKQIAEAEEIAALNLAKFRKVQGALGEADAAADANEQALAKLKVRGRSASIGPM